MEDRTVLRRAAQPIQGTLTVLAQSDSPAIRTEAVHFSTTDSMEFWDLTDIVRDVVVRSRVRHGQVTVGTPHTTTSIVINESETGFHNDFRQLSDVLIPVDVYYEHDDLAIRTENVQEDEYVNGHAHCRQLLIGQSSVTLPVVEGEVLLGQWQKVMFVELDQARDRRAFVHAQGI